MKTQTIRNNEMTLRPFFGRLASQITHNPIGAASTVATTHDHEEIAVNQSKNTMALGSLRRSAVLGFAVLAFLALALSAQAGNLVVNGGFETTTGNTSSFQMSPGTGGPFAPDNWTFSGGIGCVSFPASAQSQTNACGPSLSSLYPGWTESPNGGNFVVIDGDPNWHGSLSQSISVVNGQSYQVSFYQAAAQFEYLNGATTEQWQVCLGSTCQDSALMNNASHGFVPWERQTLTFTANTTGDEVLSFLSEGTPDGEPPAVLLDGVSMNAATPEPGTLALSIGGLLGIAGTLRSRNWLKR